MIETLRARLPRLLPAAAAVVLAVLAALIFLPSNVLAFALGEVVNLTTRFRVMDSSLVTGIGLQEAGATGTITQGPRTDSLGRRWWFVDFGGGVDGWVRESVITGNGGTSVAATLTAAPAVIVAGETAMLAWASTGATSCTASGDANFSGIQPVSGSLAVKPSATTTYRITCQNGTATKSADAVVSVGAPGGAVPAVSLTSSPLSISAGGSATLTWSSTNAVSCTAAGDSNFSGNVAVSGSKTVNPATSTTYSLTCTNATGGNTANVTVAVSSAPSGAGDQAAFANPDDGNIPDRATHPRAFPTAMGFGRVASVRSADAVVYKIDTLADVADPNDGRISFRECALALAVNTPYAIPAGRPRYCVFDVAGQIAIQSPTNITVPRLYIAGQTSPGGIELRLGANYNPVDALIHSRGAGDHMIVRHLRLRLGEHPTRKSINGDPIRISGTRYQMLDHLSTMYGTDESLDMSCTDCTVQWSIIGPNMCKDAGHTSSLHCKTFFLKPSGNVSIIRNISQHGEQRGINVAPGVSPATPNGQWQLEVVNNVLYHFASEQGLVSNQFGHTRGNYIGNVSFRGPRYNGSDGNYFIGLYSPSSTAAFGFDIYASGNVTPHTRIAGQFGSTVTDPFRKQAGLVSNVVASSVCGLSSTGKDCALLGTAVVQDKAPALVPGKSLTVPASAITTAEQAMRDVLAYGGATLCRDGWCRDNVDAMYVDDVRTCDTAPYLFQTAWPSTVAGTGGWAKLSQGAAMTDTDRDGMPDSWEQKYSGTNPKVWDANADPDGDGYPNIEEYLNFLAQDHVRYSGHIGSGKGPVPAYNCGRPMYL